MKLSALGLLALFFSPASGASWHLAAVGADQRESFYRPRAEVVVAVLDSGLDLTHPQLQGKIAVNALERDGLPGVDDDGNGVVDDTYGYDFFAHTPVMTDPLGHGTEVAGLIAASPADGVEGLAPSFVKILPIRIVGAGGVFQLAPALAGIRYAIARGAKVINASWNVPSDHPELRALMDELAGEDILLVNSAGNEGELVEREPTYPTLYQLPNQLNVANLREELFLSFLSNFSGASVHLAAPGEKLMTLKAGGGVKQVSGTSFAAPLVSAAAALLWAMHPKLSALEMKARILESATPLLQLENRLSSGATLHLGRLLQGLRASEDPSLPQNWSTTLEGLQSPHPYAANTRLFWGIDLPGAREVVLNFARLELSLGDALEVLDAHGVVLERFTGRYPGPVQSKSYPAPIGLRLVSDETLETHGFTLKNIAWR